MVPLRGAQFAFARNVLDQFVILTSDPVTDFTAPLRKHREHHVSTAPSRPPIEERLTDLEAALTHREVLLSGREAAWGSFYDFVG